MESLTEKHVLVSGASFAGLSTAYWMSQSGYKITVIEIAPALKKGGTPVNIMGNTIDIVKRMGLLGQIQAKRITMELMEFKNAEDGNERSISMQQENDEYEIERDVLLQMIFEAVKDNVEFIFGDSITSLKEAGDQVNVAFKSGSNRLFDLVFGCDGIHSAVRKYWFGEEAQFSHFLKTYFSITIVNKLLIRENTTQMYNEPGKMIMLNAYNNKTDIVLCFFSEKEISYDYRNEAMQRNIILNQFSRTGWRTPELLEEVKHSKTFYFDKLCQMKMPSWTKGKVALVGDAGYCPSPAAGRGGSLAIDGAAALADAFQQYPDNVELAFQEYNTRFRPFIEEVQASVVNEGLERLIPLTEEAIRIRNQQTNIF
ncbi:FAD-dependent monooxygenase [Chitinophaga sp.]|uniref:FAD-dependent monooxygenase n=1 Tax=Chitinophaga sp. TaxID=1869181 RepID=UPI002F93A369